MRKFFIGLVGAFLLWTPALAQPVAAQCEYTQTRLVETAKAIGFTVTELDEKQAKAAVDTIAKVNDGIRPPTEDFNSAVLATSLDKGSMFALFKDGCYLVRAALPRETVKALLGEQARA